MKLELITGLDDSNIVHFNSNHAWVSPQLRVHKQLIQPLEELCIQADNDGVRLALLSGYRDYTRQCLIWENKILGKSDILDTQGTICQSFASETLKLEAIARWSAIPGTSRHHWGTELDIFSAKSIENGYPVELLPEEFSPKGPCAELNLWLSKNIDHFGFFRPYQVDSGGIAPEPWHISFDTLASDFLSELSVEKLISIWEKHPWVGSEWSIQNGTHLFERFVNIER